MLTAFNTRRSADTFNGGPRSSRLRIVPLLLPPVPGPCFRRNKKRPDRFETFLPACVQKTRVGPQLKTERPGWFITAGPDCRHSLRFAYGRQTSRQRDKTVKRRTGARYAWNSYGKR